MFKATETSIDDQIQQIASSTAIHKEISPHAIRDENTQSKSSENVRSYGDGGSKKNGASRFEQLMKQSQEGIQRAKNKTSASWESSKQQFQQAVKPAERSESHESYMSSKGKSSDDGKSQKASNDNNTSSSEQKSNSNKSAKSDSQPVHLQELTYGSYLVRGPFGLACQQ